MAPDNYQIQHDLAMEKRERDRDDSSIDQMRGTHDHYLDVFGYDPSFIAAGSSSNSLRKRGLSPGDDDNFDKRQRYDSLVLPPMTTSMDNLMDVIPGPMSPTRKSGRKVHELNQLPPSPSRTSGNARRKKGMGHLTKENQEEQDDDDEEHGQATTAQEVSSARSSRIFIFYCFFAGLRIGKETQSSSEDHAQCLRTCFRLGRCTFVSRSSLVRKSQLSHQKTDSTEVLHSLSIKETASCGC